MKFKPRIEFNSNSLHWQYDYLARRSSINLAIFMCRALHLACSTPIFNLLTWLESLVRERDPRPSLSELTTSMNIIIVLSYSIQNVQRHCYQKQQRRHFCDRSTRAGQVLLAPLNPLLDTRPSIRVEEQRRENHTRNRTLF